MAKPLPLDEQLISAGRLAARSWAHANLWWSLASAESRAAHRDVIDEYWESLRFVQQGHLISFIVGAHALHHQRKGTINFLDLSKSLDGVAALEIEQAKEVHKKIEVLRHEAFAHRTDKASYDDVFRKAQLLGGDIQQHAHTTLSVANMLLNAKGLALAEVNSLPIEAMQRMLRNLGS